MCAWMYVWVNKWVSDLVEFFCSCLNQCTYCKTKHARGDLGSYPPEEIVSRAKQAFQGTYIRVHVASDLNQVQGFPKLTKSCNQLPTIYQYYWPVLIFTAGCIGNNSRNWLLSPLTSSQSKKDTETEINSKWLIWLVCREPLQVHWALWILDSRYYFPWGYTWVTVSRLFNGDMLCDKN